MKPLRELDLPIPKLRSGKVREVFDLGETLLFVATDRLFGFGFEEKRPVDHHCLAAVQPGGDLDFRAEVASATHRSDGERVVALWHEDHPRLANALYCGCRDGQELAIPLQYTR